MAFFAHWRKHNTLTATRISSSPAFPRENHRFLRDSLAFLQQLEQSQLAGTEAALRLAVNANAVSKRSKTTECAGGDAPPTIRIWHVDDQAELRQLIAEALSIQQDFVCERQFGFADQAIRTLKHAAVKPDVILLDLNLGEECGLDAIKPMLMVCPSVKILMLTTFSDLISEAHALEAGATGFLLKSYRLEDIADLIRAAVTNPGDARLFPMTHHSAESAGKQKGHIAKKKAKAEPGMLRFFGNLWGLRHRTVFE